MNKNLASQNNNRTPTIKVTARLIRGLSCMDEKTIMWQQPLHVPNGMPKELRGFYDPPLEEERAHTWGYDDMTGDREIEILQSWIESGFKIK